MPTNVSEVVPHRLFEEIPKPYRAWLRAGLFSALLGYSLVLIAVLYYEGFSALPTLREPYVIGAVLCAIGLELAGRYRAAALLALTALWLEAHITFAVSGARASSGSLLPALVVGCALFVGMRLAATLALSIVVTLPLALYLHALLSGQALFADGDVVYLIIVVCSTWGACFVLSLFLRAFEQVLAKAKHHATRARELIDVTPDAILALDHKGEIEDCNPAAENLFALGRASLVGSRFFDLGLKEQDGAIQTDPAFDTLRGTPREYVIASRGITVEGVLRTVTRADGRRGSMVVLRDISQRKQAERRAKELQHQLQHSQKLEALGRLAGGVAHDFNNLLTAVGGYGDLLARHSDRLVQGVAKELAAARARGAALTTQLLAFARKEYAEPRGVDLSSVVTGMDRLLQQLLGERITLQIETTSPALIHADPGQLQQVILNLVMNAKDAMPSGGDLKLSVTHAEPSNRVELSVEDTGSGMDQATLERLFEPFFTTKPRGQGTGLGLATVHGIIETSGGSIDVVSKVGQGTKFTLRWPAYGGVAEDTGTNLGPVRPIAGRARGSVLLTEDDPQSRAFLKQLLSDAGFTVHVAHDGEQALRVYLDLRELGTPPDVLLSDVRMPRMTGLDLASRLRELDPGLPVLFVSGYLEETLEQSNFQRSSDLLLKPFTADALLSRLDRKVRGETEREPHVA